MPDLALVSDRKAGRPKKIVEPVAQPLKPKAKAEREILQTISCVIDMSKKTARARKKILPRFAEIAVPWNGEVLVTITELKNGGLKFQGENKELIEFLKILTQGLSPSCYVPDFFDWLIRELAKKVNARIITEPLENEYVSGRIY